MEQTAFSFQANYFTKLIEVEIGKYGIKPQVILGVIDRIQSATD
jgi:hypothetical protein